MGYFEDRLAKALAESADPIEIERLKKLMAEFADKESTINRMVAILKGHEISMKVGGCGCCGSPWVSFAYRGEVIIDDEQGSCGFDTEAVGTK